MIQPSQRPQHTDPDSVDLSKPLRRLKASVKRHKLLIFLTTIIAVAITVTYVKLRPPIYEADCVIRAEVDDDKYRDKFYDQWQIFRKNDLLSEAQLIIAGEPLVATIEKLDLKWDDVYHPLGSQFTNWWRHAWLGKKYREIKEGFFPPQKSEWDMTPEQEERSRTLIDLRAGVAFVAVDQTSVGSIKVRGPSPKVAEIANTIAETYIEQRQARYKDEATKAHDALSLQVKAANERLLDIDLRLQKAKEAEDIFYNFQTHEHAIARWSAVKQKIVEIEAKVTNFEKELAHLESRYGSEVLERVTSKVVERNPHRETIQARILSTEVTIIEALHKYDADSPEVKDLEDTAAQLRKRLDEFETMVPKAESVALNQTRENLREQIGTINAALEGSRGELAVYKRVVGEYETHLKVLPAKQRVMQRLLREYSEADSTYKVLVDKHLQAKVSMETIDATVPTVQIVGPATPPAKPVWPNTKLFVLIAAVLGVLAGVGAAYMRDMIQRRVERDDLEGGRGNAVFYAAIEAPGTRRPGVRRSGNGHAMATVGAERSNGSSSDEESPHAPDEADKADD